MIKNDIKALIVKSGFTMTQVVNILNERHSRTDTVQNLSNKLSRGTLRYTEAIEIADAIGYEIHWVPKDK